MALDPLELGVIALMAIGVFIWGPDKIPQIAKQVASARKQIDVYTKQLQGISKELQTSMTTGNIDNLSNVLVNMGNGGVAAPPVAPPGSLAAKEAAAAAAGTASVSGPVAAVTQAAALPGALPVPKPTTMSADELLVEMARKLGISTQGKTRDEIQSEIVTRSLHPADVPAPAPAPQEDSPAIQGSDLV